MEYKIGNILTLKGRRAKIVNVYHPLGTYSMYTVRFFDDWSFTTFTKHKLPISKNSPKHESDDFFFLFALVYIINKIRFDEYKFQP